MRAALATAMVVSALAGRAQANGEAVNGFPNWQERVMLEWSNRARSDPQIEMAACGSACGEGACYMPQPPLAWLVELNRSARFHSDEMSAQGYFAHDSACTLVANLAALYPGSCTGAASCACVGGTKTCNPTCTTWDERIGLFGGTAAGEIIASSTDPDAAFYKWLFEPFSGTTCQYVQGPPTNGHRWNILMSGPAAGYGAGAGGSVGDFGGGGTLAKLVSGAHYPRSGATVDAWASWYAAAGPRSALVNVDGTCTAMTLARGSVTNGAYHAALSGVGSGCHRYFFLFHDASDSIVTYPTTGSLGIGPAATCADWDMSRPATGAGCDCTPQCGGKQCGDDGCGGSCGTCSAGMTCQGDACVGAPSDAGADDSATGGGNNVDAGGGGKGAGAGCGCRTTGGGGGLALVAGAAVLRRRRRRRGTRQ